MNADGRRWGVGGGPHRHASRPFGSEHTSTRQKPSSNKSSSAFICVHLRLTVFRSGTSGGHVGLSPSPPAPLPQGERGARGAGGRLDRHLPRGRGRPGEAGRSAAHGSRHLRPRWPRPGRVSVARSNRPTLWPAGKRPRDNITARSSGFICGQPFPAATPARVGRLLRQPTFSRWMIASAGLLPAATGQPVGRLLMAADICAHGGRGPASCRLPGATDLRAARHSQRLHPRSSVLICG